MLAAAASCSFQLDRSGRRTKSKAAQKVPVGLDGKPVVDISLGNRNAVQQYFQQQLRGSS
jgi:uncharacterized protein YcnI